MIRTKKKKIFLKKVITSFSDLWVPFNELIIFVTIDVTATISTVLFKVILLTICVKFSDTSATFSEVIFSYKIKDTLNI